LRAASQKNIQSGFQATGIWPFDRNIFDDDYPFDAVTASGSGLPLATANGDAATASGSGLPLATVNGDAVTASGSGLPLATVNGDAVTASGSGDFVPPSVFIGYPNVSFPLFKND
jgi:hypothetical protein